MMVEVMRTLSGANNVRHCGVVAKSLDSQFRLTREVFQENLDFRLVTWWGGSPWVERLPHQNSAAKAQYPPRYGPSKFSTDQREGMLAAVKTWLVGRVGKRIGYKA